jgi:hypothetical protein
MPDSETQLQDEAIRKLQSLEDHSHRSIIVFNIHNHSARKERQNTYKRPHFRHEREHPSTFTTLQQYPYYLISSKLLTIKMRFSSIIISSLAALVTAAPNALTPRSDQAAVANAIQFAVQADAPPCSHPLLASVPRSRLDRVVLRVHLAVLPVERVLYAYSSVFERVS